MSIGSDLGREVIYCKKCLMPNTRPRIVFDDDGVCNACRYAKQKHESIDWEARREEFEELIEPYRCDDGSFDCIVPWSGGKDSSTIAYRLKFEYDMNPLLVTFSPMLPNEVGEHNREALIRQGFDHIFFRPDQRVHRHLARRFFVERGNPKVAWDAGVNAVPVQVAVNYDIPLVFYAEHGESEYGGKVLSEEHRKMRDFTEVVEHQIGDDPRNWVDREVDQSDLNPYIYPDLGKVRETGVKALYFAYFHKWDMYENYQFITDKYDFRTNPDGRTPGTFTDFDSLDDKFDDIYYYMQYIKFGFGRCIRDASRFIQNRNLTREEGLEHVRAYDGEFPERYIPEVCDYMDMTRDELMEVIDKHRNPEIWTRDDDGGWVLRHPPE